MVTQRRRGQFARAKWQLRLLAPLWVLQLALSLSLMGVFAWRLGDTMKHYDERDGDGKKPAIELAWEATNVSLSFVSAICTLVETGKYTGEALTPWTMLFTHIIKLACASAILALDVVIYTQGFDTNYSAVSIGLDVTLITIAICLVAYAIGTYRRLSSYDDYAWPANAKGYGFNDGMDLSYSYRPSIGKSPIIAVTSSPGSDDDRRASSTTNRRYSHERDPSFDEYIARRGSMGARHDMSTSMVDEGERSPDLGVIFVSAGSGGSRTRATSYSSDHLLVAVPEDEALMLDESGNHGTTLFHEQKKDSLGERVSQEVDVAEPKWMREHRMS